MSVLLPYGMCLCSGWCSCVRRQQWQPTESGCDPQGWATLLFLQVLFSQDPLSWWMTRPPLLLRQNLHPGHQIMGLEVPRKRKNNSGKRNSLLPLLCLTLYFLQPVHCLVEVEHWCQQPAHGQERSRGQRFVRDFIF